LGISNSLVLEPLFDLKFLLRTRSDHCRNFKSAAPAGNFLTRLLRALLEDAMDKN
jgi:hypothetical protein